MKKSYRGFVLWMITFCVLTFGCAFLPLHDPALLLRIILNLCTIAVAVLTYIIYRNQAVYWYNGVRFEDAVQAGPERRRTYALRHCKRFCALALAYFLFSAAAQLTGLTYWIDVIAVTVGLIAVAVSTTGIRL